MFLAIRDGVIVERSQNQESLLSLDSRIHEIIEWTGPLPEHDEMGNRHDPRSQAQKALDISHRYRRDRLREYPSVNEQLNMMYWDALKGTTTWMDELTRIKTKFPRPE